MSNVISISSHSKYKCREPELSDNWEWIGINPVRTIRSDKPTIQEFQDYQYFKNNPQYDYSGRALLLLAKVQLWIDKQKINANNSTKHHSDHMSD